MIKIKKITLNIIKTFSLTLLLFLFLVPFLLVIINSFKTTPEFIENPIQLPHSFKIDNYIQAFKQMNFLQGFINSLIITSFSVILIVFLSSMTAYLFVRCKWKISKIVFYSMVASMIIPFQAIMIPLINIYGNLKLLNMWSLIYMYIGFGVSMPVIIYHGFIKSIPTELDEMALIDGCTRFKAFFNIVFPLLKPTTVTIIILDVLWIWNDFLLPNLVLIKPLQRTLPLSTYYFFTTYTVDYSRLMAGLLMTMLPVIVMYLILQKHVIEGITKGSIK